MIKWFPSYWSEINQLILLILNRLTSLQSKFVWLQFVAPFPGLCSKATDQRDLLVYTVNGAGEYDEHTPTHEHTYTHAHTKPSWYLR